MINKQVTLLVLMGFLCSLGIYFKLTRQAYTPSRRTSKPLEETPPIRSFSINLQELTEKKDGWRLFGMKGEFYNKKNLVRLRDATCRLLSKGKEVAKINSEVAEVDTKTKNVRFIGVVNGNFEKLSFKGSNFFYEFDKQIAKSSNRVFVEAPKLTTEAQSVEINFKSKKITMRDKVASCLTN